MENVTLRVINSAIKKAENNADIQKSDYESADGILICGKCHTPKQVILSIKRGNPFYLNFKGKRVFVPCKCEKEREEKKKFLQEQEEIKSKIKRLQRQGITDKSYLDYTFEKDDKKRLEITKACKKYAENFQEMYEKNKGLMFYGQVGTGKTFYACCIANEILSQAKSVLITTLPNLISKMSINQEEKIYIENQISNVSLMVIDDFGMERNTSYAIEQITEIINRRSIAKKPLIVTTNLKYKELKNCENTIYSRIYDKILQMCHPIAVLGKSRRIEEAEKSYKFMNDFLGLNQNEI